MVAEPRRATGLSAIFPLAPMPRRQAKREHGFDHRTRWLPTPLGAPAARHRPCHTCGSHASRGLADEERSAMRAAGGVIACALTLLVVVHAGAATLYITETAVGEPG